MNEGFSYSSIDEPRDLESQLYRARSILTHCRSRAVALKGKGWLAKDTTLLEGVIGRLGGNDDEQNKVLKEGPGITEETVVAANQLYDDCLAVQNAARLEYPSTAARKDPAKAGFIETARRRFLLEEFPPRDRSNPDGGTGGTGGGPAPSGPATPPK